MRTIIFTLMAAATTLLIFPQTAYAGEVPGGATPDPHFTYQATLKDAAGQPLSGVVRLGFGIYRGGSAAKADSGTLVYGETVEVTAVAGHVRHAVGTGASTFGGKLIAAQLQTADMAADAEQLLWLQVTTGDTQEAILPRVRLAAVPYAAAAGDSRTLGGMPAESYVTKADLLSYDKQTKLSGTGANTFMGTAPNQANRDNSTVGGGYSNVVGSAVGTGGFAGTIAGGYDNTQDGNHGAIGGGEVNKVSASHGVVAGGKANHATAIHASVGGGLQNKAAGLYSTVAGGRLNQVTSGYNGAIGGGYENTVSNNSGTIAGGNKNTVSGTFATVPGGQGNKAEGSYSFAAGHRAVSKGNGSFTWADSQDADYVNADPDTFRVRARGGAEYVVNRPSGDSFVLRSTGTGDTFNVYSNSRAAFFSGDVNGIYAQSQKGRAANFYASTNMALHAQTASTTQPAAHILNNSAEPSLSVQNNGTGYAGKFLGNGQSGDGIEVIAKDGLGIQVSNSSVLPTINAVNSGNGYAGDFKATSTGAGGIKVAANNNYGIHVTNNSGNAALRVIASGSGYAANLTANHADGHGVAVQVKNGYGLHVVNQGSYATVYGENAGTDGSSYAGKFVGKGTMSHGVYGEGGASGYAGFFEGPVHVNGNLSKSTGSFRIDHPLDPEHKYLYHSFVESPDMKNIYDGIATLDWEGRATVKLPEWFEALNKDFRYLLTPIGAPAPNLYISQEVTSNTFSIAGGMPGMRVTWNVTGIRKDAYANAHRVPVEVHKPAHEQGTYQHAKEHGQAENKQMYSGGPR